LGQLKKEIFVSIIFFILGGAVGAYWFWGVNQFLENKPLVFWKPVGKHGILLAGIVLVLIGFLLL
jgi:hypothetical protein